MVAIDHYNISPEIIKVSKHHIELDQIDNLLIKSKSKEGSNEIRLEDLKRAYMLVNNLDYDSSKIGYLFKISNQSLDFNSKITF